MPESGLESRVAGMPILDFASGLRMETVSGEEGVFPDTCFVAVVDSEGNVWNEHVSGPVRAENGELDGACVPRSPLIPGGRFPEAAVAARFEAPLGSDMFSGGRPDYVMAIKPLDKAIPELEALVRRVRAASGEGIVPPPHLEGVEYDWVGVLFMVGPSDEMEDRVDRGFDHWPVLVLIGAG